MRARRGMLGALVGVAAVLLVACGGGADGNGADRSVTQPRAGPHEDVPSALDDMFDDRFPAPLIDPAEIVSGGPPPDGIPPIDDPRFRPARDIDFVVDTEGVLLLKVAGETRGYPLQIMTWHEIVNDTVGGVPVAVTYCPLCNSGVAFERQLGDRVFSFGTSGRLHENNLVMYDRQTESLWPQLTGQASVGVLTGTQLEAIPMGTVSWREFRDAHPDALVLTRDTGEDRPYDTNPYTGYDDPEGELLFGSADDRRLAAKERIVGIGTGSDAVAVVRSAAATSGVLALTVAGRELVVWHRDGQASALDTPDLALGRNIGTVAVFDPVVDGRQLHFAPAGDGFVDTETGSRWSILGQATAGPLAGTQLAEHVHVDTFWFSWVAFQPATRLVPEPRVTGPVSGNSAGPRGRAGHQ